MEGTVRKHRISRMRLIVLSALAAFGTLVPTASADTAFPVWTCRASAAYVELAPLLGSQRIEPVLANGFPDRLTPDTEQCATEDTGVQTTEVPPDSGPAALLTLAAASASTEITPQISPARLQTATADAGIAETARVSIAGLIIDVEAITSQAQGICVGGVPQLTGESEVAKVVVNGTTLLDIPGGTALPGTLTDINLSPLIRVRINQKVEAATPAVGSTPAGAELTQRAVIIEVLSVGTGEPLTRIVLGEAKVDYHGAVCAPAPPPPTCPAGSTQTGTDPLVCSVTVVQCGAGSALSNGTCVQQCPAGSTADPNAGGACVIVRQAAVVACPNGTVRDPTGSNNCILVRERPCPAGSQPDPATRVCVLPIVKTTGSSGENGRVGSPTGPRATCGRLDMFFVRGPKRVGRSFASRFGTRTVTRGRLVTCGSNPRPIVGARIDVVHVLPNGKRLRKTGMRSRAGGKLTLILPIDLRTRRIEYAYRPNLTTTRVTSRVVLRLTVRNRAGRIVR